MLKSLTLKNYRSHRNQKFIFHQNINGLVGLSQSGKTNIIRALIWLSYNRPSGTKYHSKFSRDNAKTKVTLELDNDYTISLMKSKGGALYKAEHPEHGSNEFSTLNRQVPDAVTNALNISTINIQGQIDRVFLAASSPPEIARTINKVTKIDQVDKWVKRINSKVSVLKSQKNGLVEDIAEIETRLSKFGELKKIGKKLSSCQKLHNKINSIDAEWMAINNLFEKITDTEREIRNCKKSMEAQKYINKILAFKEKLEKIEDEIELIEKFMAEDKEARYYKKEIKNAIKKYAKILKENKKCPTCFEPIKKKTIRRIINELHSNQ